MFGNITLSKIMGVVMIYDLQGHRYIYINLKNVAIWSNI